jgi:tRNA pseudouridine38-40 synthase
VPRIALLIEYAGKKFRGSQYQEGVRTVQQELEGAFQILFKQFTRAHLSGRTDSGVSARGQVAHCDVPELAAMPWLKIKSESFDDDSLAELAWKMNGIIGRDLAVAQIQLVPEDFHARRSAVTRQYVYRILNRRQRSALLEDTYLNVYRPLDLEAMRLAASKLLGRHDFTAFRSTSTDRSTPICSVSRCEILNLREGELEFWIAADHFVYNMVRIIVGTLIEVGLGKRDAESISQALERGERNLAGPTAPPWGLTLDSVFYPEALRLWEQKFQEKRQ